MLCNVNSAVKLFYQPPMCANFHAPAAAFGMTPCKAHQGNTKTRIQAKLKVKKITIKSSVLAATLISSISVGNVASAGVFDQLAAVANSALPAYGRVQVMNNRPDLNSEQIESGIKEALALASDRVVAKVVAEDGYKINDEIPLSSDMRRARKTAVKLGQQASFEQLEQQMHEAVVATVPVTGTLLKEAVSRMEFIEPRVLLTSHETAATDFLRHRVSVSLQRQLQPIVIGFLKRTGAASTSARLANEIKFGNLLDTLIANHVIEQSIDGFFDELEKEETEIRQNPASRTTRLIQRIFG